MINILLADNDELACLGIESILEILGMFKYTLTKVSDGYEAIDFMKSNPVDVLLMDVHLDGCDGFALLNMMKNLQMRIPTVVFSENEDVRVIRQVLNLGAKAFVSKNADNEFLGNAILSVYEGQEFISETAKNNLDNYMLRKRNSMNRKDKLLFKEKELIILKLLMDGMTSKEIANCLFLSPRTVEGHRAKLMRKTQTKSMLELAKYVTQNNLKLIGKV